MCNVYYKIVDDIVQTYRKINCKHCRIKSLQDNKSEEMHDTPFEDMVICKLINKS